MAALLFLSSTTYSALTHLMRQIREEKRTDPLNPTTVLLPTSGVIHDLRRQLGDMMAVQLVQFYRLGHAVLDQAGVPIHEMNDTAIRRLIRGLLGELSAENKLTTFSPVWKKPGFVEVVLDWIREMKSQGIFPESYDAYALKSGDDQDRQLAELYTRYQHFMQRRKVSDADGLLWVTAEILERNPDLFRTDGSLSVFGFDQFTPVQIRILQQLAGRFRTMQIYLLWDERRAENSLVLARLKHTRDALLASIPLEINHPADEPGSSKLLTHVHQTIFNPGSADPADTTDIQLIEAPSREDEVRRTLREVKQLLLDDVLGNDIAILAPNKNTYLPIIQTVATEYDIPIQYERSLTGNPAVMAFTNLIHVAGNFPWRRTFDALRSPYIRQAWLNEDQIALLDQLSRERPVISGRDQWEFALQPLEIEKLDREDDDFRPLPLVSQVLPDVLGAIQDGLAMFFDQLSPPPAATYREYIWWVQTILFGYQPEVEEEKVEPLDLEASGGAALPESVQGLDMLTCCKEGRFPERDMEAVRLVMRALRQILRSADIVPADAVVPWETFRDEVSGLLSSMPIPPDPLEAGVRFGRLEEGRARVVDHLFVLGLSEGEFPTPPPADPLYAPSERESHPLPLIRYSPADDASLWWQVIGSVRQKLVLLRPYIDNNGAPWQPSPYWDAVRASAKGLVVERIPIAGHPNPENAASKGELLVTLAHTGSQNPPETLMEKWSYAQLAEGIMHQRQSYNPPGEFEGVIGSASLKRELSDRYGEQYIWSATRLNRYALCPFGFFAEVVLKLKTLEDPEEGVDAMQRGSLLHAILEHLYKRLTKTSTSPAHANLDILLQYLDESCTKLFPTAPGRYGFRPGALWKYEQHELRRMLRAWIIWECDQNVPDARYLPYLQEAGFGIGRGCPPPLEVAGDRARFRLRGVIDRLDCDSEDNLRVIDYKSGSTTYSEKDLRKGLAMQTALYALAAEAYWARDNGRVAESCYWLIPGRKSTGGIKFQEGVRENDLAEAVIHRATESVAQVRAGVFPSAPASPGQRGMSCSYCDFGVMCRVSRQSSIKAKRGGFV